MVMESKRSNNINKKISNGEGNETKGLFNEIKSTLKRRRASSLSSQQNEDSSAPKVLDANAGRQKTDVLTDKLAIINANTCNLPDGNGTSEVEGKQLRQLLLLHLDLIHDQQQQIKEKDKLISKLQSQKDQLESKICRMERRLSVGTKSIAKPSNSESLKFNAEKERGSKRAVAAAAVCDASATRKPKRLPSNAVVTVSSKQFKDISTHEIIQTNSHYLHSHIFMPKIEELAKSNQAENVLVPGWKDISCGQVSAPTSTPGDAMNESELTHDDTFLKRHQKLENDERRRKRWDIQRIRQEQFNESLKQRHKGKDTKKSVEPPKPEEMLIDSLTPTLGKVSTIEISNQLPVAAFGNSIPSLCSKEFDLPWFDVDRKELQLRKLQKGSSATNRSRRKTSYF